MPPLEPWMVRVLTIIEAWETRRRQARARLVALLDEVEKTQATFDAANRGERGYTPAEKLFKALLGGVEASELPRDVEGYLTAIITGEPVEPTGPEDTSPPSRKRLRRTR